MFIELHRKNRTRRALVRIEQICEISRLENPEGCLIEMANGKNEIYAENYEAVKRRVAALQGPPPE